MSWECGFTFMLRYDAFGVGQVAKGVLAGLRGGRICLVRAAFDAARLRPWGLLDTLVG